MTDTTTIPATPDAAPIDAEFEPAPPREDEAARVVIKRRGPGWGVALLLGTVSLTSLALAAYASGFVPGFAPKVAGIDEVKTQVAALKTDSALAREDRTRLSADISKAQGAAGDLDVLKREMETQLADVTGALSVLETDVAALSTLPDMRGAEASSAPVESVDSATPDATLTATVPEALEARISALETAVAALEDARVLSDADVAAGEDLTDTIADLRADIDALKAAPQSVPAPAINTNIADAALALSAIEAAARRGKPFQTAFDDLSETMPDAPILARLEPLASENVPTYTDLRRAFDALQDQARDAAAAADTSTPGWMRTVFGDGLKVRRDGEVPIDDLLQATSAALAKNNLDAAFEQIDAMPGSVQSVFTDWRDSARKRQVLEDTLDALRLTMIAKDRP